ncbi:hypothetical protein EDD18DRAFT_1116060 [Armillaria luteobubalina]|uniref:Ribonuclease H1 N-terminal domain-containing protein n=1 Tax=Armillaria luteobubalina TaxID=153913 RepID=A0AA39P0Z9_9AGAR|nr:hypothetical protein EDD18DRAFT_1116060 [Armillaria luteobubalina]
MVTQAPTNALTDCSAEQLAQLILVLQSLGLINLAPSTRPSMPQGNNEPSPSHAMSSLRDTGPTFSGGGTAILATTTATSHTGGAVKKESTKIPSAPSKVANTAKNEAPGHGRCPPTPASSLTEPIRSSSSRLPWYMVMAGYEVGVFQGWDQVAPLVLGVSGAVYQCQPSRAYAHAHFATARSCGNIWVIAPPEDDNKDEEDDSHYYED